MTACIRSVPRLALLAGVLGAVALCCSCANSTNGNSYVRDRVSAVRGSTVPSDAAHVNNSGPTVSRFLATARWEFETSEERRAYLSWVSQQLERDDFKLKLSDESGVVFTKGSGNESESVRIRTSASNEMLHVQINYTIDSD
jgi:hypothetical protein